MVPLSERITPRPLSCDVRVKTINATYVDLPQANVIAAGFNVTPYPYTLSIELSMVGVSCHVAAVAAVSNVSHRAFSSMLVSNWL